MTNINTLIKPVSGLCNLKCKYCFYNSVSDNREIKDYGIMTESTLENIVKKSIEKSDDACGFTFQGGEPTLVGLEFYNELLELQNKYNTKNIKIYNSIQTNGMTIDEKWAKFLSDNNFLVGLSLDGYKEVHNLNRVEENNLDTHSKVIKCIELFNKYNVDYNILSVVTANTARHANKIYSYFKESGFKYIQFIQCLDPMNEEKGKQKYSLTSSDLERFLKITFDRWYEDFINNEYISIRYFDNLVKMLLGARPESCNMIGQCSCNLVIEADGSAYPCDFYVTDSWYLGNINEDSIDELVKNNTSIEFVKTSLEVHDKCTTCKYRILCRGGCRREREDYKNKKIDLNYYCEAYRNFFEYSYDRLIHIARIVNRR